MDLTDFFSRVLPGAGLAVICYPRERGFKHLFYKNLEEAAAAALSLDSQGKTVYFGCASYQTDANRKAENAAAARSFWLDVDAGDDKPYATGLVAAKAVLKLADLVGLPQPLLVSSGGGIHVYWPMSEDITPAQWGPIALKLKVVARHAGLVADPSRTSDIASVLRPVGTHHRKREPRLVKVVVEGEVGTLSEFEAVLDAYIGAANIAAPAPDDASDDLNSDLSGGMEYPPANAQRIADQCAVVGNVRDTAGIVDQPTWYHTLQILAHCTSGEQLAHEWSKGHPNYTHEETATKFAQASKHKPTLCAKFHDHHPASCEACPHFGKIKSPIALGMGEPQQTVTVPAASPEKTPAKIELPYPYQWDGKRLVRKDKDRSDDGSVEEETVAVSDTLLYFRDRYDFDDEGMGYLVEYVRQGELKQFYLTGALINKGGSDLVAELGKHEIGVVKNQDVQLYLKAWMSHAKEQLEAKKQHQHFGWQPAAKNSQTTPHFLVGDQLLKPKFGAVEVLLKDNAAQRGAALKSQGSADVWKDVIDRAYNHPGMESLQFLVLCGFAAPLFGMFGELGGVTVYAHSEKTGRGKSTACQAALSVWGHWPGMMLANDAATINAFWAIVGTYHNLPVVFDELTNMEPPEASKLVFGITEGRPRERLDVSGKLRDNNSTWRTILMASGNNLLSEKLGYNRANASAELARLFEFTARATHEVDASEASALFRQLLDNNGHAGVAFARHIVDNYDSVLSELIEWRQKLITHFRMPNEERYWSALFASVVLALKLCRGLGLLQFDMRALIKWIGLELQTNRGNQVAQSVDPKQHFSRMLGDLAPGIIETDRLGDVVRNQAAFLHRRVNGPVVGRMLHDSRVLWLSIEAVRKWCVERKISADNMIREVTAIGWVEPKIAREALGRGTLEYSSVNARTSVYVVDMSKIGVDTVGASSPRGPVAVEGSRRNVGSGARGSKHTGRTLS